MKVSGIILALAIFSGGCASLPAKQKAVVGLQTSELALEGAHDTERNLCSPTADKTQPITHCDGVAAATLQLTDARHQQLATLFSNAFDAQGRAAVALQAWQAGEPAPASLAEYRKVIQDTLDAVLAGLPNAATLIAKIKAAVDSAAQTAALVGVK
jgi:hypothetical protein